MKLRKRDLFLLVAAPALMLGAIGTAGGIEANEVIAGVAAGSYSLNDWNYNLVKDASTLNANDLVVFVNGSNVMSTTQNGNNRGRTTCTVTNEAITDFPSLNNVAVFKLSAGSVDNTFAFQDVVSDQYLYAAGSGNKSNYLRSQNDVNGNASFSVTIASSGYAATLMANGSNTNKYLRWNSSNNIFSCYGSNTNQNPVYLYKLSEKVVTPSETITISGNTSVNTGETITISANKSEGLSSNTLTWHSSNENAATIDENGVVTGLAAGTTKITATCEYNSQTITSNELTITVNDVTPSISLDAERTSLYIGSNDQGDTIITATPHNLGDASISWEVVEGENLIEIEADGNECLISALSDISAGGSVTVKASATVNNQLIEESIELRVIKKEQLATATNLSYNNSDYKLSWGGVANATSYKVTVTKADGSATSYTSVETTNTFLKLENLNTGNYKFKVEAFGTDSTYVEYLSSASDYTNFHLTVMVKNLIEEIVPVANLGFAYAGYENTATAKYEGTTTTASNDDGSDVANKIGVEDVFTVKAYKAKGKNNGVGFNKDGEIRLYSGDDNEGSMMLFEPTNGHKITSIKVTATAAGYAGFGVGADVNNLASFLTPQPDSTDTVKTFDVYSDSFFIRDISDSAQARIESIEIHTINITSFSDVSMKFRATISDEIYNNIESITAVGARLSVDGSEQHIDFAGTAENITAGTNEHHFTFRVDDIPSSAFETSMTIAPYITGNIDGEVQTVYLQEKTISVNGMIADYEDMTDLSAQQEFLISAFKTHYGID